MARDTWDRVERWRKLSIELCAEAKKVSPNNAQERFAQQVMIGVADLCDRLTDESVARLTITGNCQIDREALLRDALSVKACLGDRPRTRRSLPRSSGRRVRD